VAVPFDAAFTHRFGTCHSFLPKLAQQFIERQQLARQILVQNRAGADQRARRSLGEPPEP
jgi:hypothetical protein